MKKNQATSPPFLRSDPARWGFQYIEDLSTSYWYAQVLFCAVELELFGYIEKGAGTPADLANMARCEAEPLDRLLTALVSMELIHRTSAGLANSQLARRFLVPGTEDYMGDFILYRRYMQTGWSGLLPAVESSGRLKNRDSLRPDSDYETRNFHYVRAMDRLARIKAREIVALLDASGWSGPILDVGGGAGTLSRALIDAKHRIGETVSATLLELAEVIGAARRLYPEPADWDGITPAAGDFRNFAFKADATFGMVVLSNFLHAYNARTARRLLEKAAGLMAHGGLILIHDYFPDRGGTRPHKGALYDIHMMLNTYDGACHPSSLVCGWLADIGVVQRLVVDLPTDTSIILAGEPDRLSRVMSEAVRQRWDLGRWADCARELGFSRAELIDTDDIRMGLWTREKCRFGCAGYGRNRMCPPRGIEHATMERMLGEYDHALIVVGAPPGRGFHDRLLALERAAFLGGLHKALAFGAGPCPVCEACAVDEPCRHPDQARPSMEGSGIDVYETAHGAGIRLEPVPEPGRYVKYIGMVLLR